MKDEKDKSGKLKWDELVFGTIEKLASAPSKLKDPKELGNQAFEWVKGIRDDLQEKITREVMERIRQLDWDVMAKKVAEHLAENYDVEVSGKVSFKPKTKKKSAIRKAEGSVEDPGQE